MNPLWINEQPLERAWTNLDAKLVWEVFTKPHGAGYAQCGSMAQNGNDADIIHQQHDQMRWLEGPAGQLKG